MNSRQNQTNINWYPGHMAKTKKQIVQDIALVDVVLELLDARIPIASSNPEWEEMLKNKKRIIVLNKADLAEEKENQKWVSYFAAKGIEAVCTDASSGRGIPELMKKIEEVASEKQKQLGEKGRVGKSIRVMILGIPNVGKSSMINRMTKKTSAIVGNKPGVTRQKQWVRLSNSNIELLDTPGMLWPKLQTQEIAMHLAYTGTIKDDIMPMIEVAYDLTKFLLQNKKKAFIERYHLEEKEIDAILTNDQQEENENILEIMYLVGKKRGAVLSGGRIDEEKTARILLDDFRSGKIGRITVETVK